MGGDETGNICVRGKALSMNSAVAKMADLIAERVKNQDISNRILCITHCQCPDRARAARDAIMEKVPFKECRIYKAGGISTIYANDGGIIVAY